MLQIQVAHRLTQLPYFESLAIRLNSGAVAAVVVAVVAVVAVAVVIVVAAAMATATPAACDFDHSCLALSVAVTAPASIYIPLRSVSISFLCYQFSLFVVFAVICNVSPPLINRKIEKTNRN